MNEDQDFCLAVGGKKPFLSFWIRSKKVSEKSCCSHLGIVDCGWKRGSGVWNCQEPPGGAWAWCLDNIVCVISSYARKYISLDFSVMGTTLIYFLIFWFLTLAFGALILERLFLLGLVNSLPRPGTRQLEIISIAQSLPKLIQLPNLKLTPCTYPALPISSHKNSSKDSGPCSLFSHLSASWPTLVLLHLALCGNAMPLVSRGLWEETSSYVTIISMPACLIIPN